MLFRSVFWFPMVLNDPCDHRYVLYTHGGGPGSLWEASGLPPKLPGVIAGGVRLVSLSALGPGDCMDVSGHQRGRSCHHVEGWSIVMRPNSLTHCLYWVTTLGVSKAVTPKLQLSTRNLSPVTTAPIYNLVLFDHGLVLCNREHLLVVSGHRL